MEYCNYNIAVAVPGYRIAGGHKVVIGWWITPAWDFTAHLFVSEKRIRTNMHFWRSIYLPSVSSDHSWWQGGTWIVGATHRSICKRCAQTGWVLGKHEQPHEAVWNCTSRHWLPGLRLVPSQITPAARQTVTFPVATISLNFLKSHHNCLLKLESIKFSPQVDIMKLWEVCWIPQQVTLRLFLCGYDSG